MNPHNPNDQLVAIAILAFVFGGFLYWIHDDFVEPWLRIRLRKKIAIAKMDRMLAEIKLSPKGRP